jgi:hypothetical protein
MVTITAASSCPVFGRHPEERLSRRRISFLPSPQRASLYAGCPILRRLSEGWGFTFPVSQIFTTKKTPTPPRKARRPPRHASRSDRGDQNAQLILECGGSAAAFPKPPALQESPSAKRHRNSSHHHPSAVILRGAFRDEESHPRSSIAITTTSSPLLTTERRCYTSLPSLTLSHTRNPCPHHSHPKFFALPYPS